jgi:hypothetical protein
MHSRTTLLVLYLLVVVAAIAGTAWTALAWQRQLDHGPARLLATSHSRRMVEYPGVEAWLVSLLERAGAELPFEQRQVYDTLRLESEDLQSLPASAAPVAARLHAPPPQLGTFGSATLTDVAPVESSPARESMRVVQHVQLADQTLVLTRRRSAPASTTLEPELELAAAQLVALAHAWAREPPAPTGTFDGSTLVLSEPKLARFYAIVEDGSVLIMPVSTSSTADPLAEQTAQAWSRPFDPNLGSLSVFPKFDFGRTLTSQVHYTGLYPDVTGLGFVATVSVPVVHSSDAASMKMIFAADLTVEISLEQLIADADSHLQLQIADVVDEVDTPTWKPWTRLGTALSPDAPVELREAIHEQMRLEDSLERRPLVWAETTRGVLFAQQIQHDKWLVGFAETPSIPWLPLLFVPGSLIGMLAWTERRRAKGERLRDAADRQREQAFDLLRLPLVVVDPNDDAIVHANPVAAREFGLAPGRVVHEHLIAIDPRAQKQYQDHQTLAGGRRRAYGVRLRPAPEGPRFALIRSVSLTEALPDFHAAANHRLGLICPIEGDADLAPLLEDELIAARQDERNKLATLLDHGVDMLARVLAAQLRRPHDHESPESHDNHEFHQALADYLFARLHVTQWILDHWGGERCRDIECILGPEHLRAALAQLQHIFVVVGRDPTLRAQLHWNNGTLASPIPAGETAVKVWIDWPEDYRLTTPAEGLFGYFLGEALINAIKHGAAGVPIELDVDLDRARHELCIRVRNSCPTPAQDSRADKSYGGSAILDEMARICGWELSRKLEHEVFELRWFCPVTLQRPVGSVD